MDVSAARLDRVLKVVEMCVEVAHRARADLARTLAQGLEVEAFPHGGPARGGDRRDVHERRLDALVGELSLSHLAELVGRLRELARRLRSASHPRVPCASAVARWT